MEAYRSNQFKELRPQIARVWQLSVPAILTQITTIAMQYIDSAMVGRLGANASAAIGLVSTSSWMLNAVGYAVSAGFSVQVAQFIGAEEPHNARRVVRHGVFTALFFALLLAVLGIIIHRPLPRWLGGDPVLWQDASRYFLIYACALPFMMLNHLSASCLQSAGNMVAPSILNALMCLLDVIFNAFFIPRYGVLGAALGTGLAMAVIALVMLWLCLFGYEPLRLRKEEPCPPDPAILKRALRIGTPVGGEELALSGAMVATTVIIAPLGPIAIAANSFAVTAESLCYMPGFGVAAAAATLVGQSVGAKDLPLARRYGYITTAFGSAFMGLTGLIMFLACPLVFRLLTPVAEVQQVAAKILRIGLIAEPLYGASIVASGALRGAADTLVPSLLILFSIWVVRLSLALLLVGPLGITGVWIAMAIELCFRGLIMIRRLVKSKYLREAL